MKDAEKAVQDYNNAELDGMKLNVHFADHRVIATNFKRIPEITMKGDQKVINMKDNPAH